MTPSQSYSDSRFVLNFPYSLDFQPGIALGGIGSMPVMTLGYNCTPLDINRALSLFRLGGVGIDLTLSSLSIDELTAAADKIVSSTPRISAVVSPESLAARNPFLRRQLEDLHGTDPSD